MGWWIWILVGLGLLAVEVIVPGGIILLFFGAAAIVVGAFVWLGIGGPVDLSHPARAERGLDLVRADGGLRIQSAH